MITSQEYWTEIQAIAASLADVRAAKLQYGDLELSEAVWQITDGHQWVIYYANAPYVIIYTDNRDAYIDEFGEWPAMASSTNALLAPIAMMAMQADIYDQISHKYPDLRDQWDDYDEYASENPPRRRRRARRNFPPDEHGDLVREWDEALGAGARAAEATRQAGAWKDFDETIVQMSYADGQRDANQWAMREDYGAALDAADSARETLEYLAQEYAPCPTANPPRSRPWISEKLANGLTLYLKAIGRDGGLAIIVPYKPRKSRDARQFAAYYEQDVGQKVPRGTKWILVRAKGTSVRDTSAHKTLKAAKAKGDRLVERVGGPSAAPNKPKRRRRRASSFKVAIRKKKGGPIHKVSLPNNAKATKVGTKYVHRSVSAAGGKLRLLKTWTVSNSAGRGLGRYSSKAVALKAAKGA